MRIKKKDTEEFKVDESSVLRHFLPEESSFSISFLDVDGVHENSSEAEIAYFVLEGQAVVKLDKRIVELSKDEVFYVGNEEHVIEGKTKVLVVRSPPAEKPEEEL